MKNIPTNRITVSIADDHTMVRRTIAKIINQDERFLISFEAINGHELLEKLESLGTTELVIMDLNMPVMNGFEAILQIKKKYKKIKLISLSAAEDDLTILRLHNIGIDAYLFKTMEPEDLIATLCSVHETGCYFPEKVKNKIEQAIALQQKRKLRDLKKNELTFLQYVCSDLSYKDIAKKMHVSRFTIDDYRNSLFQRFDVDTRIGLVLTAVKHKIVEL